MCESDRESNQRHGEDDNSHIRFENQKSQELMNRTNRLGNKTRTRFRFFGEAGFRGVVRVGCFPDNAKSHYSESLHSMKFLLSPDIETCSDFRIEKVSWGRYTGHLLEALVLFIQRRL